MTKYPIAVTQLPVSNKFQFDGHFLFCRQKVSKSAAFSLITGYIQSDFAYTQTYV
ncbi:hypothetical protein Lpp225_0588 [Lacticaseibacillus paracasei subsp. paracasei Lpp225]|uniref:Uncharacterized protein n=1 Tax=Lacticaseibacillus paracasei subsp. paracasei Lpp225 TaxID=1256225 RepID=S2NDP6_LACPA|nr:hypothetical protein Lpp225_0588 [Lacticaseibacillus paracasei subsp. paracasei Lpp225]